MNVLVTGGNGQLGQCIKSVDSQKLCDENDYNKSPKYFFTNRQEVDITNQDSIETFVKEHNIDVIVNCAAYTNVEKAEDDYDTALSINYDGVHNLVNVCRKYNIYLIHISTDYVFDGKQNRPYREYTSAECNPLNNYGKTKLLGENVALEYEKSMVIRTSWLYSEYGKNFYRTMLNRVKNKQETRVVCDQVGTPTYARDLAEFLCMIIEENELEDHNGLFHFSNYGCCSWYDFAATIETLFNSNEENEYIFPCSSNEYKCKAERPLYTVLNKEGLLEFPYEPRHWYAALIDCMLNDENDV